MPQELVPESLTESQRQYDYTYEATQLSQSRFETQNTQGTAYANSQVEPRRKYWAILIPTNSKHNILKIAWTRSYLQIGRGPMAKNDVVLNEKRVSNTHCRITLGLQGENEASSSVIHSWKDGDAEPDVWIQDLGSSNGSFVNGERVKPRRLLQHGDEISLGHAATLDNHDVRYIFRSVGRRGARTRSEVVGEVYERYQLLGRLGKGSFADVHKAVDVETGDLRAIKQIVKHRFAGNAKTLELFQREIQICQRLTHENICRLIEWYEDPQHICLVLEYVDGGDLLDYIMTYPKDGIPEDHAARLSFQICSAMDYTHSQGVTHRDLKPENILLTLDSGVAKIADFGLAKMVESGTMLKSMVGTPQYLAPEIMMQSKHKPGYENKVDSWSIGIIVYSMLTKALPFDEDTEMPVEQRIKLRYTVPFDTNLLNQFQISARGIDFIAGLLAKEPEDRFSMPQALAHPWLALPSSQSGESQANTNKLCGDSVWSIESFDADSRSDYDEYDANEERSRTNFESDGHIPSDGFSQPMSNLQLHTPARTRVNQTRVTQSLPSPAPSTDGENAKRNNGQLSGSASPVQEERPRKSMRIA